MQNRENDKKSFEIKEKTYNRMLIAWMIYMITLNINKSVDK